MKRLSFLFFALALASISAASCNVSDDGNTTLLPSSDCPDGQSICDGECFDLSIATDNCGTCGNACDPGNICTAGVCEPACPAGYVACGDTCVNPQNDPNWCGATDACDPDDASLKCAEGEICSAGSCELVCADGTIECDGRCVDPDVDRTFCGAAGNCSGGNVGATCLDTEVCSGGTCVDTCPAGSVGCDGGCIDPLSNPRFCGASDSCTGTDAGTMCAPGEVCSDGACEPECVEGQLLCDGSCIDPMTNDDYCGAVETCVDAQAGEVCNIGEACLGGACFPTDYFFFSPFNSPGTRTHPRDLAYQVDTLVDGITMHYTLDGTTPVPGEGTTMSTDEYIETEALTNDQRLRVVFEEDGVLTGVVAIRHRTDPNQQVDVNTPDNFSVNGGGIIGVVAPGDEVNVTFDTLLWKLEAQTSAQAAYFVDGVGLIHCESLAATPPGMEKSLDLTFTAPAEVGTYFIRSAVTYEDDCAAVNDDTQAPREPHAIVKVR